jgi:hypothetical protein
MNNVVIIGDLHLHNFQRWGRQKINGLNYRATMTLASLRHELDILTNDNSDERTIVFAGDVFDTNKPEPALIAMLMEMLGSFDKSKFYLMTGNHDVGSSGADDHSLAPFKHGPSNIVVVDKPMHLNDNILMHPWLVSGSLKDSIEAHRKPTTDTVIAHGFIEPQPFEIEPNADLTAIDDLNVIAGHVHTYGAVHRLGKSKISIGAFGPTAFGDDGGCYVILGTNGHYGWQVASLHVDFGDLDSSALGRYLGEAENNPAIGCNIYNAMTFYRICIDDVEDMPRAKTVAKYLMRSGSGGVEIKLNKKKHADVKVRASLSNAEDAVSRELDAYCNELKLVDYQRDLIQEALKECIQKAS